MRRRPADELFYDSEATLRLVDDAIEELRGPLLDHFAIHATLSSADATTCDRAGCPELPPQLVEIYAEIERVVGKLRQSRDLLQGPVLEAVQHTSATLLSIGATTRIAVAEMIDGLDRALAILDQLDAEPPPGSRRPAALRGNLRTELHRLLRSLQFQDITSQQLAAASETLAGIEARLASLATLLHPAP
jgi:hypothetical protein